METTGRGHTPRYWVLIRDRISGPEVFTQRTPDGAMVLPVFLSAEKAGAYVPDGRYPWRPRKTGRGELASILMGVCREAGWVTLDPPPGTSTEEALERPGASRDGYLQSLLGKGRARFQTKREAPDARDRTGDVARGNGRAAETDR